MTASYAGVRSRFPDVRSGLVASGVGGFRARVRFGGAEIRVTLCGLRTPLRLVNVGVFRPCSRSLIPGPRDWAILVASGSRGSRADVCIWVQMAYAVRVAIALSVGLSGEGAQTKLPGRKFQSHPGVPPARLIDNEGVDEGLK